MADESTDLVEEVVETEATEDAAEEEVAEQAEEAEQPEGEGESEEDAEEEEPEEIEFDLGGGQKVKFSANATAKEIAEEAQRAFKDAEANLTRRSQDVAETRKSLEAQQRTVEKMMSLTNESLDAYSRGLQLRAEIEQLEAVDLRSLRQSDPDRARWVSDELALKRSDFQKAVNQVSQKESELSAAQQGEVARRKQEGEAAIEKQIKGFRAEKLPAVIDYAVNTLGMNPKDAENDWALNPAITVAVHKAMLWDQAQAKAKLTKPKPQAAQPVTTPKPKGKARNSLDLVKDADKIPVEEWVRRERERMAKKAG